MLSGEWRQVNKPTGTMAMNLPNGCLVRSFYAENAGVALSIEFVPGVHWDEDRGWIATSGDDSAATKAFDRIAKLCGCEQWEYPGQVVRDVEAMRNTAIELLKEVEYDQVGTPFVAANSPGWRKTLGLPPDPGIYPCPVCKAEPGQPCDAGLHG